jgi:hypothetical protein
MPDTPLWVLEAMQQHPDWPAVQTDMDLNPGSIDCIPVHMQSAGDAPCGKIADNLISTAVSMGSTDDVTVCVLRLGTGSSA